MNENEEKAKILKDSLLVIQKLAKLSTQSYSDDDIVKLIKEARIIKNNKYFKL